jgi:hypothetical protein
MQVVPPPPLPKASQTSDGGIEMVTGDDANIILDWKGDPMVINPGDKLGGMF